MRQTKNKPADFRTKPRVARIDGSTRMKTTSDRESASCATVDSVFGPFTAGAAGAHATSTRDASSTTLTARRDAMFRPRCRARAINDTSDPTLPENGASRRNDGRNEPFGLRDDLFLALVVVDVPSRSVGDLTVQAHHCLDLHAIVLRVSKIAREGRLPDPRIRVADALIDGNLEVLESPIERLDIGHRSHAPAKVHQDVAVAPPRGEETDLVVLDGSVGCEEHHVTRVLVGDLEAHHVPVEFDHPVQVVHVDDDVAQSGYGHRRAPLLGSIGPTLTSCSRHVQQPAPCSGDRPSHSSGKLTATSPRAASPRGLSMAISR